MKRIVDRSIYSITVWYNPNTQEYYYKLLTSRCFQHAGYKNGYYNELILVIDIYKDIVKQKRMPIYLKILKRFISFLQKLDNKFSKKYLF